MTSMSNPSFTRRVLSGGVLFLGMLALSSCAGFSDGTHEKESTYEKASDMGEGTFELQNWIPRAATDVRIKVSTTAEARPIASFTLPEEQLPESCTKVSLTPPEPQIEADWMPEDAADAATLICGDFAVITDRQTMTVWDTRAPENV